MKERADVALDPGAPGVGVPDRKLADDLVEVEVTVGERHDRGRGLAQPQAPFGGEQDGGPVPRIRTHADASTEARLHGRRPGRGLAGGSATASATASRRPQRMVHFATRARTHASWAARVVACATTNASASSASRVARGTRARKEASAAPATP